MRGYRRSFVMWCVSFVILATPLAVPEAHGDRVREGLAAQLIFNTLQLSSAAGTPPADVVAEYRRRGTTSHGVGFRGQAPAEEAGVPLFWSLQIAFLADDEAIEAHDQMPNQFLQPYARGIDRLTGAAQFVIPEGGFGKQRVWFVWRQDRTSLNMTLDRSAADADEALAASLPRWHFFVAEAERLGLVDGTRSEAPPGDEAAAATADLLQAARTGDVAALRRALAAGAAINAVGEHGATALAWAVANGHPESVRALLDAGADWRLQSPRGQSPLNVAVYQDDVLVIRLLLDGGADVDERIIGPEAPDFLLGATPLFLAAAHGNETALAVLLAAGAKVDATNRDGATALFQAASMPRVPVVRALLAAGAAADHRDAQGATPLTLAADSWGRDVLVVETILLLVEHGADPNRPASVLLPPPYGGMTPLGVAAHGGHVAAAATLLLAGADPSRAGPTGLTPFDLALQSGKAPLKTLFAEPESAVMRYLTNLLAEAAAPERWTLVDLLVRHGLDLDRHDEDGRTLLIGAVNDGDVDWVARLLEAGAAVDARDSEEGATALIWAAGKGEILIVDRLLSAGADPNRQIAGGREDRFAGWSALMIAAQNGDDAVVMRLLDAGAKPWLRNAEGLTALDLARAAGNEASVALLQGNARD